MKEKKGLQADTSSPTTVEVRNAWIYTSSPLFKAKNIIMLV
jgi:hypothetical protein